MSVYKLFVFFIVFALFLLCMMDRHCESKIQEIQQEPKKW